MTVTETIRARGQVTPSFIDIKTGECIPWDMRHNTLSFDASKAVALAFGGDDSLIPNRMGIIYGEEGSATFPLTVGRQQSWDSLVYELSSKSADVQIQPFSYSPSFTKVSRASGGSSDSDASDTSPASSSEINELTYPGWAVTFHAHSDSVTAGALSGDSSSSSSKIFTTDNYIFQALLLNEKNGVYTILARVSLDNAGEYYTKPENFEVALDWTVKFF